MSRLHFGQGIRIGGQGIRIARQDEKNDEKDDQAKSDELKEEKEKEKEIAKAKKAQKEIDGIKITVKTLTGKEITLDVDRNNDTIGKVKQKVQDREGIQYQPEMLRLIWGGKEREDDECLSDIKDGNKVVENGSVFYLRFDELGGAAVFDAADVEKEKMASSNIIAGLSAVLGGLTYSGACNNKDCTEYQVEKNFHFGYGKHDFFDDRLCSTCKKKFVVQQIMICNSKVTVKYRKVKDKNGKRGQPRQKPKDVKKGDVWGLGHAFDKDDPFAGTDKYISLEIKCEKLDK